MSNEGEQSRPIADGDNSPDADALESLQDSTTMAAATQSDKPVQKSFIAAGLGIGGLVLGIVGCCCGPIGVLGLLLGVGGVFMGMQVKKAVASGELHAANGMYATIGLAAGGVGILFGLFNTVTLLFSLIVSFFPALDFWLFELLAPFGYEPPGGDFHFLEDGDYMYDEVPPGME